ncbi:hypothetical protein DFH09DRAFT_1300226 [Mycena vulgaris]|nr:hypothetical protein DFH09DRAFT_1300226 [Mycena vulgaris]
MHGNPATKAWELIFVTGDRPPPHHWHLAPPPLPHPSSLRGPALPRLRRLRPPRFRRRSRPPRASPLPRLLSRRCCQTVMGHLHLTTAYSTQSVMHTFDEWPLAILHDPAPVFLIDLVRRGTAVNPAVLVLHVCISSARKTAARCPPARRVRLPPAVCAPPFSVRARAPSGPRFSALAGTYDVRLFLAFPSPSSPHRLPLFPPPPIFVPPSASSSPSTALLTPCHLIMHSRSATPSAPRRCTPSSTPRQHFPALVAARMDLPPPPPPQT